MQQSGAVSAADSVPSAVPVTHRYGCVTVRVRRLSQRQSNASDGSGALSEVQYSVFHSIKNVFFKRSTKKEFCSILDIFARAKQPACTKTADPAPWPSPVRIICTHIERICGGIGTRLNQCGFFYLIILRGRKG